MVGSTPGRVFLDTNVLIYALDTRDAVKQLRAQEVLTQYEPESLTISAQVLGEFYWTVTRKLVPRLSQTDAQTAVERLSSLVVVAIDTELVQSAIDLSGSASIAYWDALIVKAASSSGCTRLLTEDLNHSQVIDGVQIINPFRGS